MLDFLNTSSSEIKLFYQTYGEDNPRPQDAILLTPDINQKFGQDMIDDLVNKGLWNRALETQLENNQLYFKVFRDDEDMIPVDAVMFDNVRMLPNRGLLDLDEPLQNAISRSANWFSSFIPESIKQITYNFGNSLAEWAEDKLTGLSAYSSIPKVKELDEVVWQEMLEKSATESELSPSTHNDVEENTEKEITTTSTSCLDSLFTTIWDALTYAADNPVKTLVLLLAASSLANRVHLPKMKFESPSLDFTNGISTATNILTKLAVTQIATRGQIHTPMSTILTGMSLWDSVAATSPEFQVNTYTTDFQNTPSVASFSDGSFVVIWESIQNGLVDAGIYGQRFNATGGKIGLEFHVNNNTASNQQTASVTSFANGGFVVVWMRNLQEGSSYGISGQRFNATGAKIGLEFQINTYTTDSQSNPSVASFADGGFVVTWMSYEQDGSDYGLYGQRFNATGAKIGSEFQINTYTTDSQEHLSIASFENNNFVVTWGSYLQDGSFFGIYGQRFNATGAKIGSEFLVNTYTTGYQSFPSVATFVDNSFVITWRSDVQDGSSYGIYGQRFAGTGLKIGSEFQINTYTTDQQNYPSVASFLDGSFVVTWESKQNVSDFEVYGQRFNAMGAKIGSEFQVNTYTTDNQDAPSVASFADGSFVVTWQSYEQGLEYDVYGRVFTPPRLDNNTLIIHEGQTKLITNSILSASVLNATLGTLNFTISNVTNGQFELVSSPGAPVFYFTQQQITLDQVQFVHDSSEFAPAYQVKVREVVLDTTPVFANIIFTNINDAPSLTVSSGTLSYSERSSPTVIVPNIAVFDVDNLNITNATVRFISNVLAEDVLSFTMQGGISGTYSNSTGILTLTGSSSVPSYQSALRSVAYFNPSLNPSLALRTVAFTVNDGQLNSNTVNRSISVIPVNDPPTLTVNTLTIGAGQSLNLTSTELLATDPDTPDNVLTFTVSAIQFCRFERVIAPGSAITTFTQQDINTNQIRIVATGGAVSAPSYQVSVSDGEYSTTPTLASVSFDGGFVPTISVNKLTISQGGVVILTSNQLNALDVDTPASGLTFTVSNIHHGFFSYVSNPLNPITTFTLQAINDGSVQFIHDDSENAPSYDISVGDGAHTTSTQAATITYNNINQAPVVINAISDRLSEKVDQTFSFQVAANTFFDSDPGDQAALVYSSKLQNGNALPTWISFDTANRQFTGKPVGVGKTRVSVFARDPSNAVGVANFTMDVSVIPLLIAPEDNTIRNALIGAGVSAAIGFTAFAIKYAIRKALNKKLQAALEANKTDAEKKQQDYNNEVVKPIASHINEHLKITGPCESIKTSKVKNFVNAVQLLVSEMRILGIEYQNLSQGDRNIVHATIVRELKSIAHPLDETCCAALLRCGVFKAEITPQQIENNAEKIVKAINKALNRAQFNAVARVSDPKETHDLSAKSVELKPISMPAEASSSLSKLTVAEEEAARSKEKTAQLEAEMADMKKQMAQLLGVQTGSPVHTQTSPVTAGSIVEANPHAQIPRPARAVPSV